jgi:hypothetical protein
MASTTFISHLKTIALATVVSTLVWIFAEGESLQSKSMDITATFPTEPTSPVVIRPEDPHFRGTARVRLEATARSLEMATTAVGSKLRLVPGSPGVPSEPGNQRVVDLREAVAAMPELKALGVSVTDVQPRSVVVKVIRMVGRELPVRVELGADVPTDGDPISVPATVTVRMPESAMTGLPEGAAIIAGVSEEDIRRIRGDGPQTVPATLRVPAALNGVEPVIIQPDTCTVNLRVRRKVETYKIPTVPVWYSLPPTEDGNKWSIEMLDKFLTDVTLTGPSDEIARVRATGPGQLIVKAMVELSSDDLQNGIASKTVTFPGLPPGVTAASNATSVRVKIGKRNGEAVGKP